MAKKKSRKGKSKARAAPAGAEAKGLQVPRNRVGATVQAMISVEGATHVEAFEIDAQTFEVVRLA